MSLTRIQQEMLVTILDWTKDGYGGYGAEKRTLAVLEKQGLVRTESKAVGWRRTRSRTTHFLTDQGRAVAIKLKAEIGTTVTSYEKPAR